MDIGEMVGLVATEFSVNYTPAQHPNKGYTVQVANTATVKLLQTTKTFKEDGGGQQEQQMHSFRRGPET
eukprot:7062-Amphidinium_carterae.1